MAKDWCDKNPEKSAIIRRSWWKRNPSYQSKYRKKWGDLNPEKKKERKRRYDIKALASPRNRLSKRMRNALRKAINARSYRGSWQKLVGYDQGDLKRHLERQFLPNMGWHNMREWHIDHIIPVASFSYENENDPDFKACWALTNLRPIWAKDNLQKNAKRILLI